MKCNARQMDNGKCGLTGEGCIGEACMYHEPGQTNGDRIRAMSDRELASFLAERYVRESCLRLADDGYQPTATQIAELHERLHRTWLMWLRQPAEV